MYAKKYGFTMIELIFVIVILGILAAVAIPKLAATRDDAEISAIITNARTVLGDFTAYYTSKGPAIWTSASATVDKVTLVQMAQGDCATKATAAVASGTQFFLCDGRSAISAPCLIIEANATHVNVSNGAGTSRICTDVQDAPVTVVMTSRPVQLGGSNIIH